MTNHDDLTSRLRHGVDRGAAPELSADLVTGAGDRPAPHLINPAVRVAGTAGIAVAALGLAALVVVPSLVPRAPLFTAATASDSRSAMSAEGAATSDMKIGWWVQYNYSAAPGLSTEPGRGQVYRLALDGGDPAARTAALAEAFGLEGAPAESEYSDATYPVWVVGPQDGTAAGLSYNAYGTGDWWYNDPTAGSTFICDASTTPEQATEYGCVLPENAPENQAPTADEARTLAKELLAATGFDTDAATIDVYADDWSTTASAYLSVDGERTALTWGASWSNTGDLSYAYGHSVRLEAQGEYDTVSPTAAVDRLNDGRWFGSAGPDFQGGAVAFAADVARTTPDPNLVDLAAPDETVTDATDPGDAATSSPVDPTVPAEPTDPATPEPGVVEPLPEETPVEPLPEPTPEVVDVVVDNATATLVLLWDVDGNAWLVPGYAMQTDDGWWNAVVSLVDGVIALPEPMQIEPGLDPELLDGEVVE
ncbi:hypothetical protein M2152_001538 [Microbacteriaceae bacterium SG_E_30_P1]|uniref:Uncharacterized protein n=1 Tax=Antiquaquibacter oligotrophicus TaxID=2880260 RepID=A0ABT6KMW2_9MICO|nr:hypothetical protein [Antiquaquibacter oligotrophicus]MDH6181356.1 hypothetical protein [Antiquaquibacter oligotrophicus]UDF12951.1 hypothetical protein LH407_12425 [Antiquaquibacter oligotrophicus]